MPFSLEDFIKLRPYVYHLTHRENLRNIQKGMLLESAATIIKRSMTRDFLAEKRTDSVWIETEHNRFHIRDQKPLHVGNVELQRGWRFEDLVEELNRRVYFWPGNARKPIKYGMGHAKRYVRESPVMLRVPMYELIEMNAPYEPAFCRFNSGAPRCNAGRRSPRGPDTFVRCGQFPGTPGDVVEVTYANRAILPPFEIGQILNNAWIPLVAL